MTAADATGDASRPPQEVERPEPPAPQAERLRERAQMKILTVGEPHPDVTKTVVRQLLSALESAERYIAADRPGHMGVDCP